MLKEKWQGVLISASTQRTEKMDIFKKLGFECIDHPHGSPELNLFDYFLFSKLEYGGNFQMITAMIKYQDIFKKV